jgi:hypothetical protein
MNVSILSISEQTSPAALIEFSNSIARDVAVAEEANRIYYQWLLYNCFEMEQLQQLLEVAEEDQNSAELFLVMM